MKNIIAYLITGLSLLSCKEKTDPTLFYLPAEWEEQEAVWLGWDGNWEEDDTLHIIISNVIKALQEEVHVVLWVSNDSLQEAAVKFLADNHVPTERVEIIQIPGKTLFWSRDVAPVFVINQTGDRMAIDFNHTGYFRYKKWYDKVGLDSAFKAKLIDNNILMLKGDSLMSVAKQETIKKSWMYIEGGAIEVNGKGTLLTTESFVFNSISEAMADTLTKKHFEIEFKRLLGVKNVIWLHEGLAEDDARTTFYDHKFMVTGTGGHVDEFARFANANTILLASIDEPDEIINPVAQETKKRMGKNYEILKNARDQDGKSFNIIKVPMPDHIIKDFILDERKFPSPGVKDFYENLGYQMGDTLNHIMASSYLNFLISNNLVLVPSYVQDGGSKEKEESVKQIFNQVFPDRKLVFINSTYVNSGGGGIHCITRQVPALVNKN